MNEPDRSELEQIKSQYARLERDLQKLADQLQLLESRLNAAPPRAPSVPAAAATLLPAPEKRLETVPNKAPAVPPPIPPIIPKRNLVDDLKAATRSSSPAPEPVARFPEPPRMTQPTVAKDTSPVRERSFEMRLGTYWLVRVGIVMLLTGLIFFGNYAYQNFIGKLGPAGKVSLLYTASAMLLGAGAWWQRKTARESLRNYAQVLFAGGLAAVYFTTYAAHHIENLRVIASPLLDGAMLLGWAGFMVWTADRKKSEVLALFAIGLAYYSSVITRVGSFTLYSNLVLTVAAVVFLVRNRWAGLTFASLGATYLSYGFWRFFDGSSWHWASPEPGLWQGACFLMSYWLVFTTAVFLSKHENFRGPNRATFLTLNNGAFFVMFLLTLLQVRQGGFWKFCLGYGTILLVLAEAARRALTSEPIVKNAYLTQGLLLVTVGLITKFTGLQLALMLAAESVVLMSLGTLRQNLILRTGAYLCGALAVGWGIDGLEHDNLRKLALDSVIGAMMAFNAFQAHRHEKNNQAPVRALPACFTVLALISWLAATWYNTRPEAFPLALAVEALALTASVYALRVPEFVVLGQGYLVIAQVAWLIQFMEPGHAPPWWNPALLMAVTLGLSHWWQRQKVLTGARSMNGFWQGLYALALMGVLYFWLSPLVTPPAWLALAGLLAAGITAYGVLTRAWFVAAFGQIFVCISALQFALQLAQNEPEWYFPLAPILVLGFLSGSTLSWFQRRPDASANIREPLLQIATVYRWLAVAMCLWWVQEYIPPREQTWVLALMGLAAFSVAGWRAISEALLVCAAFEAFALGRFWIPLHEASTVYAPNLLAILALLGQQRAAKRWPERYPLNPNVHGGLIILGGLSLWLLTSRWVNESAGGTYLTAAWSALALVLFACGMALRERVYRWVGLGVLATALGRVFIFDVWKLETLYRILSFMALGIVLLVLGFIYNKYQEKIKEWL